MTDTDITQLEGTFASSKEESNARSYFAIVVKLITEFAFSLVVYSDNGLVEAITKSLPLFYFEIVRRQYHDTNIKIVANVVQGLLNIDINSLKKEDEKRLCFELAFIMMFNFVHKDRLSTLIYPNIEAFIQQYPEFKGLSDEELNKLLIFCNVMKISLIVIPAKNHKNHILGK